MRLAFNFDVSLRDPVFLIVLWALGICMIGLAGLIWLPARALAALSLAMIVLHNTMDRVQASQFGDASWMWNLFHQSGVFRVGPSTVIVGYPLVPWIAVMALGFVAGQLFLADAAARRRFLIVSGAAATLCVRGPSRAQRLRRSRSVVAAAIVVDTALSFLNTTKNPPSLAFLLMTLGPPLLALAWFDT